MVAKIGNEKVERKVMMPFMYLGNNKLFTHGNTYFRNSPPLTCNFDDDAVPGLTGINACNSEYGTKICIIEVIFLPEVNKCNILFFITVHTYTFMWGVFFSST